MRTAPATLGQRAQWFEEQRTPSGHRQLHNIYRWWTVDPPAAPAAVEAALTALVTRHEGLRTTLVETAANGLVQRVHAPAAPMTATTTLSEVERERRPAIAVLATTAIDLGARWPVRFGLVVDDAGRVCRVLVVVHHCAIDAMGRMVMERDFRTLLRDPGALARPAAQPCDIAEAERSPRGVSGQRRSLDYFRAQLLAMPSSLFPTADTADPPDLIGKREREMVQVDLRSTALPSACRWLRRVTGLPTAPLLLGAYATLLSSHTGQSVLPVKTTVINRFDAVTRDVVACLSQPMLAVLEVRPGASLRENAAECHSALLRAYRHGKYDIAVLPGIVADVVAQRGPVHFDRLVDLLDLHPDLVAERRPDPAELEAPSACTVTGPRHQRGVEQVFRARVARAQAEVSLLVDTACLSETDARSLVAGVESAVVDACR